MTPAEAAMPLTTAMPATAEAQERNTAIAEPPATKERSAKAEKPGFRPIFEEIHEKIVLKKELPTSDITVS